MESSQCIDILKPLDFVAVGGGAIQRKVGELLAANGVRLLNHYGATEIGPLPPSLFRPKIMTGTISGFAPTSACASSTLNLTRAQQKPRVAN